ncbi:ferrous iron transporter B [Paraglaciecola aquimarina]|uniref:Ferrous iron transport protein B n=1 Tax=Paraglaciecola algarum TaxID=3050085 RepID=A0ABS9D0Y4_9ALTE|nr:ferrous iron transporter B [Paraglaciecola sp. G1-23]MCF2946589.1 ferrous iron transporter B [Paraglaciecola sp. G1-23]
MKNIILVGKPNSGKSLLFNQMTGMRQKVANFPGVTVELKSGQLGQHQLVDFPGTYSLKSLSKDEELAIEKIHEAMHNPKTALVVCNLDATRLESSLVFGLQVRDLALQHNKGVIFALNMIDEVQRFGHQIDTKQLSKDLGCAVFALSAKTLIGLQEFKQALLDAVEHAEDFIPATTTEPEQAVLENSRSLSKRYGIKADVVLKRQNRIDDFLLNSLFGGLIFLLIMFLLFQSIFTWASPLMDAVEIALAEAASVVSSSLPDGMVNDFVTDALFGGVGSFLVFVPQIMVLTFVIGLLEDTGYLARAALICHKPLSYFGLSGRSFIPYLSGHACAIPAIMAARTIESPRKRLITMMTIPLMSCSARLPVYALLIAVLIPDVQYLGGVVNLQGITFFVLYFIGIVTALLVSVLLNKMTDLNKDKADMPFILELPTYRLPHWKPLIHRILTSAKQFIRRAGPVIFMVSVVIWVLGYFPQNGELQSSYLAMLGQWIEPIFEPLGLDWRYGVAILVSFLAREVFVGALGTLFGMENADENISGLAANIQTDGLALGAGIGLMLFYVVALQCVATVATLKGETGSRKIAWGLFLGYGFLAYCLAWLCASFI